MTNTLTALDQFTQALGPLLPPPAAHPAAVKAAGSDQRQPVARRSEGITRPGPRGDWLRRVGLAVLVLAIGLGFARIGWAVERAGESYCRRAMAKAVAGRQQGNPTPPARRLRPFLSRTACFHQQAGCEQG